MLKKLTLRYSNIKNKHIDNKAHVLFTFLCICLWIVVSNTYRVVLFWFACLRLVSCVPNIVSFSGLSILDCLFVFPNVYFRSSVSLYVLLLSFIYTYLPHAILSIGFSIHFHDISVWWTALCGEQTWCCNCSRVCRLCVKFSERPTKYYYRDLFVFTAALLSTYH